MCLRTKTGEKQLNGTESGSPVNEKAASWRASLLCPARLKEQTELLKRKAGQRQADSGKECFVLKITKPEAASAETVRCPQAGSAWHRQWVLGGSGPPDREERTCPTGASEATDSAPSTSGLFVTEQGAVSFRREVNRFRGLLKSYLQHAFIKYFTKQKAHFRTGKPL